MESATNLNHLVIMSYPKIINLLPETHPLLREKSEKVSSFEGLKEFSDLMLEKMYECSGIGLAAPQVGVPFRLFVIHIQRKEKDFKRVCVNPEILESSGEASILESCLSVEEKDIQIPRFSTIKVKFFKEDGELVVETIEGLESICFQHELDHLDGILISDY